MFLVSIFAFYALWCVLLPLWCKNQNLGFLRLWSLVPIRTVLGTVAKTGAFIRGSAMVRNFGGVKLGTIEDLQAVWWSASVLYRVGN